MACPKSKMEFYFNENRSMESTTDTSDTFSLSSTPKAHPDLRGSLYKPKLDPMSPYGGLAGRASPGHDLGYHTLLTRDSVSSTPTHTPSAPRRTFDMLSCSSSSFRWSDVPSSICNTSPYPRSSEKRIPPPPPPPPVPRNQATSSASCPATSTPVTRSSGLNGSLPTAWEPQLWTSVCLNSEKVNVDKGLKTLFRLLCRDSPTVCLAVERILLSGCSKLTDKGLFTIARKCPELKSLEIKGCSLVTNAGIAEITARCVSVLRLDLTGKNCLILINSKFQDEDENILIPY
ncbi:hypothetical protein CEXT_739581 [Caerostris extrusa]|uniref:Uncharacterized protein n=1 Tax=Caerostris extrusa TaxID=172846 RepID=A0AAV4VUK8_CAEEX|nr:hypothetical protein CEXT_739581 [Caerostris extrusa]